MMESLAKVVILVKTGVQLFDEPGKPLDSRLRGNDDYWRLRGFASASMVLNLIFLVFLAAWWQNVFNPQLQRVDNLLWIVSIQIYRQIYLFLRQLFRATSWMDSWSI